MSYGNNPRVSNLNIPLELIMFNSNSNIENERIVINIDDNEPFAEIAKISSALKKYGFNEMFQKTKDSIVNASISTANYIKETGKNIIENETIKNALGNVNKKYNEMVGKAEDFISKDNINKEKIREKINKDNNNPSDIVSQLKDDL